MQYISDLHSKFALRPHHVWKYGRPIQSATAEIRRGKKEERNRTKNIMFASATQGGHKNRHLGTIAQLCRAICSQLRHVSTIKKCC